TQAKISFDSEHPINYYSCTFVIRIFIILKYIYSMV
ncbi:hypothetical protein LCGC14_2268470, partial [marine sediment metagenome]